jgi:glycosyltransferase involved in cell wall biosynthesis
MAEMPGQPLVTVGVPVFDGEALLERALGSIVGQTYQNLEIVVSDNASTDGTAAIIAAFAARDQRFRCFRQPVTLPALANFRFVLDHGSGKYFFWAPHDDWWDARFIELGVAALEKNPDAVAAMGTVRYFNAHDQEVLRYDPPYPLSDRNVYRRICKYLTNVVTDHLYYALFRRRVLLDTIWTQSPNPDKVVIMHALLNGPIIDGWGMSYYNRYIPKSPADLVKVFALPSYSRRIQALAFVDVVREIWRGTTWFNVVRLVPLYFFSQSWHKFFIKWLLEKNGFRPR